MLTGATFVVQVIGFARQLFLAAEVGISSGLDALLIALAAPLALVGILTAGVGVAIVPAYAEVKDERGAADARRLVGAVLVWTAIAGALLSLFLWGLAEPIAAITGPGLAEAGTLEDAAGWIRSLAPLGLLLAVSGIFSALCQAESMFVPMAVSSVLAPLLTLGVMVATWDDLQLDGLVLGTLVGASVGLAVLVLATAARRRLPLPQIRPRGLGLRRLLRHAVPISASAAILQANLTFDRAVASWLVPGGVSALRYGESIVRIPFAAIRPAWGSALYPALVRTDRDAGQAAMATMTERMVRYAIVFFVPLAWLTLAVAPLAVATAYDRGAFGGGDVLLTAQVVAASAPLIVTWTVAPTLVTALNARRMGTVMMVASIVNVALNLVLNVLLGYLIGVTGVALATSLVSVVMVLYFSYRLTRIEPSYSPWRVWRAFVRASLASLPSAVAFGLPIWAGLVEGGLLVRFSTLVFVGVAGLSTYYVLARRLGLQEAASIIAFARNTLKRIVRSVPNRV